MHGNEQVKWDKKRNSAPLADIIIVCDNVKLPVNAGSVLRLADAFGVKRVDFCGHHPNIRGRKVTKVARNVANYVHYRTGLTIDGCLQELIEDRYSVISTEICHQSKNIMQCDFAKLEKAAIVVGGEVSGISTAALTASDYCVHIPMHGHNLSMNLSNALAIALYELSKQMSGQ